MEVLTVDPSSLRSRAAEIREYYERVGRSGGVSEVERSSDSFPSESLSGRASAAADALVEARNTCAQRLEALSMALSGAANDFEQTDESAAASSTSLTIY